jgi:hypothetical protein
MLLDRFNRYGSVLRLLDVATAILLQKRPEEPRVQCVIVDNKNAKF